jgi:hypothetical protein
MLLTNKLKLIRYLNKRDKRIKFARADDKYTSNLALKKAKQLLWQINSKHLPLVQNATYCYSFVWTLEEPYENKKYYVVDIYDDITYARVLNNPAEIYSSPQFKDKVQYSKLYNNINKILTDFLNGELGNGKQNNR